MCSEPSHRPAIQVEPGGRGNRVLIEEPVAAGNTGARQVGGDGLAADAELSAKYIDGGAGLVALDLGCDFISSKATECGGAWMPGKMILVLAQRPKLPVGPNRPYQG